MQIIPVFVKAPKLKQKKEDPTILAITDFSKSSTNAILFAAHLFRDTTLKINLLNIFENPTDKATLLISVEDILMKESVISLKKQAAEIAFVLKKQKPTILSHSISEALKKGIAKIAESEKIDLIVAGIPAGKYPSEYLNDYPILYIGQSKYPVLLVPENCVDKPVRSVLTLNFDSAKQQNTENKDLEHIVNHDHIAKYTININEKKIDRKVTASLQSMLKKEEVELITLIPAPGDKIDKALLDYRIQELYNTTASLLSY